MTTKIAEAPTRTAAATISEAATFLRVSRTTIYQMLDAGRIPFVTIGRRGRRIPWDALERFLNGHDVSVAE